jgi:hypothetical protein
MTTFARRQRRPYRSEAHARLDAYDPPDNIYRISARDLTTELGLGSRAAGIAFGAVVVFALCVLCWVIA